MPEVVPTAIELHKKSRVLSIAFSDGKEFELPCEYLRVFSRAAEHLVLEDPVFGKEEVNIVKIEPQGSYALRLYFDDGHDTGIYSFETLYQLGLSRADNWQAYLDRLKEIDQGREPDNETSVINVAVSLGDWLADDLGIDELTIELKEGTNTVADALDLLRQRPGRWSELLQEDKVDLEVEYEEVYPDSPLDDWDELHIIPK